MHARTSAARGSAPPERPVDGARLRVRVEHLLCRPDASADRLPDREHECSRIGCESSESTRQATVYVSSGRVAGSVAATTPSRGCSGSPTSIRLAWLSYTRIDVGMTPDALVEAQAHGLRRTVEDRSIRQVVSRRLACACAAGGAAAARADVTAVKASAHATRCRCRVMPCSFQLVVAGGVATRGTSSRESGRPARPSAARGDRLAERRREGEICERSRARTTLAAAPAAPPARGRRRATVARQDRRRARMGERERSRARRSARTRLSTEMRRCERAARSAPG